MTYRASTFTGFEFPPASLQNNSSKRLTRFYPTCTAVKSLPSSSQQERTNCQDTFHTSPISTPSCSQGSTSRFVVLLVLSIACPSVYYSFHSTFTSQHSIVHFQSGGDPAQKGQSHTLPHPRCYRRSIHPSFPNSTSESDTLFSRDPLMVLEKKNNGVRSRRPKTPMPPSPIDFSISGPAKLSSSVQLPRRNLLADPEYGPGSKQTQLESLRTRRYCAQFDHRDALPETDHSPPSFLPSFSESPTDSSAHDSDSNNTSPELIPSLSCVSSDTHSDASSSGHDAQLGLGFPRPPAMTVGISPLFSEEETDAVRVFLKKRWGVQQKSRKRNILSDENGASRLSSYLVLDDPVVQLVQDTDNTTWEGEADLDFSWEAEEGEGEISDDGNKAVEDAPLKLEINSPDITPATRPMPVHRQNITAPIPGAEHIPERVEAPTSRESMVDDEMSLVLRFLRVAEGDGSRERENTGWQEGVSAMPESVLDITTQAGRAAQGSRARGSFGSGLTDRLNPRAITQDTSSLGKVPQTSRPTPITFLSSDRRDTAGSVATPKHFQGFSVSQSVFPRVARKMSSMRSLNRDRNVPVVQNNLPETVHLPSKRSSALDRLDASISKLKAHNAMSHGKSVSLSNPATTKRSSKIPDTRPPLPPPMPPPMPHKVHRSRSFAALPKRFYRDKSQLTAPNHRTDLAAPFLHQSSKRQPICTMDGTLNIHEPTIDLRNIGDVQGLKSFMNMTPEHEKPHPISGVRTQKEKVRKLLARASHGFIGWGKSLTGTRRKLD
jgi:hypothetical protein